MENYCNIDNQWNGHLKVIRSLNILYPPTLESFSIGQYTDTTLRFLTDVTYDTTTYELNSEFRRMYVTNNIGFTQPKLIDTDLVQLADGSFKTALELQVGDDLKTIIVPNADSQNLLNENVNYHITLQTFLEGATYSTNEVKRKEKIEAETNIIKITFTDNTDWEDTSNSRYLIENNGEIKFLPISELVAGDVVILIDTTDSINVNAITKTVATTTNTISIFEGWIIEVDKTHIFLTKTEGDNTDGLFAYATIEHNCSYPYECPKSSPWCSPSGYCS
jgi:hypothetical protein